MVDLDPNSWKCIYSVLTWGSLSDIVLILGAFHTDLSFLGSIGHIMKSLGLKQILALVYPENTVNQMLSGKAYYRAMRGLFLTDAAFNMFILKQCMSIDDQSINHSLEMFKESLDNFDESKAINDKNIIKISNMFKDKKRKN